MSFLLILIGGISVCAIKCAPNALLDTCCYYCDAGYDENLFSESEKCEVTALYKKLATVCEKKGTQKKVNACIAKCVLEIDALFEYVFKNASFDKDELKKIKQTFGYMHELAEFECCGIREDLEKLYREELIQSIQTCLQIEFVRELDEGFCEIKDNPFCSGFINLSWRWWDWMTIINQEKIDTIDLERKVTEIFLREQERFYADKRFTALWRIKFLERNVNFFFHCLEDVGISKEHLLMRFMGTFFACIIK